VEGAVRIVYARIFAHYRERIFTSLAELNEAIWDELENVNQTAFKGRTYSRRDLFDEIEKSELAPLPRLPYEIRTESRATVMKNGHVALGADKHYYSVPYRFIGCKVKLMYSGTTVDIYYLHECIATHGRVRKPFGYTSLKDHLASTHRAISDWSAEYFLSAAQEIGHEVHLYIQRIFELRGHPEQAYRSCQGVLSFARRVGNDRLRRACMRALDYGSYSYRTIKSILEKGLDSMDDAQETDAGSIPDHDNIRGTDYYKRFDPDAESDSGEEEALV
jgi:hypothetical protein